MKVIDRTPKMTEERGPHLGSFCTVCGSFLVDNDMCTQCGQVRGQGSADDLHISITVDVLRCPECETVFSIGTLSCPKCGAEVASDEPTDPQKSPLNKRRIEAIGDIARQLSGSVALPDSLPSHVTVVTDEQLIEYVRRHNLFSADLLVGNLKTQCRRLSLDPISEETLQNDREALASILSLTQQLQTELHELQASQPNEVMAEVHTLTMSAYRSAIDLHASVGTAALALTMEDVKTARASLQLILDRLTTTAEALQVAHSNFSDSFSIESTVMSRRLMALSPDNRSFEHKGSVDLAEVLLSAFNQYGDLGSLADLGLSSFSDLITIGRDDIADEEGLLLFMLTAELASTFDPMTIRRWARLYLEVLSEAHAANPEAMTRAMASAEVDMEDAISYQLNQIDQLRSSLHDSGPIESKRQILVTTYANLAEWCYRRLVNLLLSAKFIRQGKEKPYEVISSQDFATKIDWLSKPEDTRLAAAYYMVRKVIRNGASHGDFDIHGERIRTYFRDKKNPHVVLDSFEYTDEEFEGEFSNLLLTCTALRMANQLFRLQHSRELPEAYASFRPRPSAEAAKALLGLYGLRQGEVHFVGRSTVVIGAEKDLVVRTSYSSDMKNASFTLALLFPSFEQLILEIREGGNNARIDVDIAMVGEQQSLPSPTKDYAYVRLRHLTILNSPHGDPERGYVSFFLKTLARFFLVQTQEITTTRQGLPYTGASFEKSLVRTMEQADEIVTVVKATENPALNAADRERFIDGFRMVIEGLRSIHLTGKALGWAKAADTTQQLALGIQIVVDFAAEDDSRHLFANLTNE